MKYSKHKTKNFLAGKGFYLALAACIAAVMVAAFAAAATITSVEDDYMSSSHIGTAQNSSSDLSPSSTEQAGQNVSDVEDTRPPESSKETPVSSEKAPQKIDKSALRMPVAGSVGKNFSDKTLQYSKTYGDMRLHLGIDLQAKEGQDVVSATAGTVKDIYDDELWGKTVVIDHGFGVTARYCGLKNVTVSKGEKIGVGIKIGVVGTVPCEREDPSHIHIAIIKDGKYVSPADLLYLVK